MGCDSSLRLLLSQTSENTLAATNKTKKSPASKVPWKATLRQRIQPLAVNQRERKRSLGDNQKCETNHRKR